MLLAWVIANTLLAPLLVQIGPYALGANVASSLLIGAFSMVQRKMVKAQAIRGALILGSIFIFSFLSGFFNSCGGDLVKSGLTYFLFMLLVVIGLDVGRRAKDQDWLLLQGSVDWILLSAYLTFVMEFVSPQLIHQSAVYRLTGRLVGIFGEPSHVAYLLFPLIAIKLSSLKFKNRAMGWFHVLILFLISRSSTLMILVVAWVAYKMILLERFKQGIAFLIFLGIVIIVASLYDYKLLVEPFVNRVAGVFGFDGVTNISSLVYIQGWQDAVYNLKRTSGFGLGFNQMGCDPIPQVSARSLLATMHYASNADDGSFLVSKIVSEFGVWGICLVFYFLFLWIKQERRLKFCIDILTAEVGAAKNALLFTFVVTSFVRSAGYFFGEPLLILVAIGGGSHFLNIKRLESKI